MKLISNTRNFVRRIMNKVAGVINRVSRGKITPNMITLVGFLAHVPIALLIASDRLIPAALALVIFGLLDAVDGALARLQNSASSSGMLLDASTDRLKEVLIYTSIGYNLAVNGRPEMAYLAILACGFSLSVSYVKAKGESAIATSGKKIDHAKLNRLFSDGLASFDIRMLIVMVGLLSDRLLIATAVIAILALDTALKRLYLITRYLDNDKD